MEAVRGRQEPITINLIPDTEDDSKDFSDPQREGILNKMEEKHVPFFSHACL